MKDLIFQDVSLRFSGENERVVFDNFSHTFEGGKINCVLGASGVGKTTLLNVVAGLKEHTGSITGVDGKISYIFQNDRLIPTISVYKNLDLVLRAQIKDKAERKARIQKMLALAEVESEANKLPHELSGGQSQRVAFVRAFIYPSSVLLMDEPFKALDTALKSRLIKTFLCLNEAEKRTVIFVTHAPDEALLLADNVTVLSGSPCSVSYEAKIDILQSERTLSSDNLESYRKGLLVALGSAT